MLNVERIISQIELSMDCVPEVHTNEVVKVGSTTPEQEYDEALRVRNYAKACSLYKGALVHNGWTNERYIREGYKCGAFDEGEQALVEEIIPGIERAIDKFFQ